MLLRAASGERGGRDWRPEVTGLHFWDHGGGCCGVSHLLSFPIFEATEEECVGWIKKALDDYFELEKEDENGNCIGVKRHCIEVILNEQQLNQWCAPLEKVGFKQVFSFLNDNSGNECHIFLLETGRD